MSLKKHSVLYFLSFLYVIIPVSIFLVGYCKWYVAVISLCVLAFSLFNIFKDCFGDIASFAKVNEDDSRFDIERFLIVSLIVALWVYFSGIGAFVYQTSDHTCRNTIYEMLVNYSWPVSNDDGRTLIYYIGFWLPSALVGKVAGIGIGYCAQALWAWCGIMLFYYLLCQWMGEMKIWPLLVFMGFSGLDIIGYFFSGRDMSLVWGDNALEWWSYWQFSSFTTQLFWVFNQALPVWIALMLIMNQKRNRYVVLILGSTLLCSTFPFVGLLPFAAYVVFVQWNKYVEQAGDKSAKIKLWFRDTFTFANVIDGGLTGIVSFLYLRGNESGMNVASNVAGESSAKAKLMMYIVFIIVEVGVYFALCYKYHKKSLLYWISFIWLCICPAVVVGFGQDFTMRASIPAQVILCLFVIDTLRQSNRAKDYLLRNLLIVTLCIGAITPIHELYMATSQTSIRYYTNEHIAAVNVDDDHILYGHNFSGESEDNFFFKYVGR